MNGLDGVPEKAWKMYSNDLLTLMDSSDFKQKKYGKCE